MKKTLSIATDMKVGHSDGSEFFISDGYTCRSMHSDQESVLSNKNSMSLRYMYITLIILIYSTVNTRRLIIHILALGHLSEPVL